MTQIISMDGGPAGPSHAATDVDIVSGGAGCGARRPLRPAAPSDHAAVMPDPAFDAEDRHNKLRFVRPLDRTSRPSGRATGALCHRGPRTHLVVACILTHAGRVCLLRRSQRVASDPGKWHCVTGFVPAETPSVQQAYTEIYEETGLRSEDLHLVRRSVPLRLVGGSCTWTVLPYLFEVRHPLLSLNWEHDAYRWAAPGELPGIDTVAWLADVRGALDGAGPAQPTRGNRRSAARAAAR